MNIACEVCPYLNANYCNLIELHINIARQRCTYKIIRAKTSRVVPSKKAILKCAYCKAKKLMYKSMMGKYCSQDCANNAKRQKPARCNIVIDEKLAKKVKMYCIENNIFISELCNKLLIEGMSVKGEQ